MSWQKYTLCFRLLSPLHIGYRKVGNLMQTRGYVPGKVLWAALTARLTRDFHHRPKGHCYVTIGESVHDTFRFGYLYPALKRGESYEYHYPWEENFDYLFLDSHASTALNYEQQAAAQGQLHETEFIRPWTRLLSETRESQSVYLIGDLYVRDEPKQDLTNWRIALSHVQLGGERGYGWGRVQLASKLSGTPLSGEPVATLINDRIIAHLKTDKSFSLHGSIEPLVGWERNNAQNRGNNWHLSKAMICYTPGSITKTDSIFNIGPYGIWESQKPFKIKTLNSKMKK